MATSSQALTAAYESCLNEAFRQCPSLIQRWCGKLVEALYERSTGSADASEKRKLQDAIAALKKNQPAVEEGFAAVLTRAIVDDTSPVGPKPTGAAARSFSSLSFDELELMGDNQVQETVESARLQQVVAMVCESGLAGFSARLSTAQGFKSVKADRNPLRPEVFTQALLKLLQDLPVDNDARTRWLTHGAQPLGEELLALYVLLNDRLAAQGIAPAPYGVVASPTGKRLRAGENRDAGAAASAEGQSEGPASPGPDSLLTLDHLHRLLVGEYDASFKENLLPSDFGEAAHKGFSHTVPAAMDVLAELQEKGIASTREKKTRIKPPQSLAQMRAQLKSEAKSLGQSLAIEVVGLMIEQMAHDPRLLAPVRELIANAEPAFLRLGVSDPRFFSDKAHPARRLLEAITAKSLAYNSEDAPGFAAFMDNLNEVGAGLTEEDASDAEHFAGLLRDFEARTARDDAGAQSQGRAVQALLQAEQRNLLADRIAGEILARPDFVSGNRAITAFITGPWAQVMAKERLLGEHGGVGSQKAVYSLTLGELLWSIDINQASRHRKRLIAMIPNMLKSLREGLLSIDYPLAHSKAFFDELMVIHQAALKADAAPLDPRAQGRRALEREFDERDQAAGKKTWLAPEEAQDSGFMNDWGPPTQPAFESTQPHSYREDDEPSRPAQQAAAPGSVTLGLGAWVELLHEDKWLRAQLTWISPYNTLFLFTSEGGKTHSMTAPLLQYLLLQELVKVVSQQGVLDGALDKVARTAMRNSVERSSGF